MKKKKDIEVTVDGKSVEQYQEEQHDKEQTKEISADYKKTLHTASTMKANISRARSADSVMRNVATHFYDGRGRTQKAHVFSLAEKVEEWGEKVMEFKLIQDYFTERSNKPATVAKLRDYIAEKTGKEYTIEGLRGALRKFVELGTLRLLVHYSGNIYNDYPKFKRTSKMMFFNLTKEPHDGTEIRPYKDDNPDPGQEPEPFNPLADAGPDPDDVEEEEAIVEASEPTPPAATTTLVAKPANQPTAPSPDSEIESLVDWMTSNDITDFVLEIEFKE